MRRFRPRLLPTLAVLPALVLLLGLGTWQVQRMHWKTDLIATIEARTSSEPVPLLDLPLDDPAAVAWQRTQAVGRFVTVPGPADHYGVENRDGQLGGRLLGAVTIEDGRTLLVDRGFLADAAAPPPEPAGQVELDAIVRDRSEERQTWFMPDNDPASGRWFWLDLAALGGRFDRPLEPVALQLLPGSPGATPEAAPPKIDLPNNHLGYVITWYGLAFALLLVYLAFSSERTDRTP
ncbi:SURF1 family protein [Geminicoccus flavidas]|uniref:SURF1 family protein n=1 Tax=Geminicoccus flavidas TaxID=2506407 RepID=UPI001358CA50|nr:SURF1 family protein [Geminicoccus flavidas]